MTLGVWMIGALGGIGTTIVVGARALAADLVSDTGLATTNPAFAPLDLVPIEDLVFGGHEVRVGNYWDSAYQIYKRAGSLDLEVLQRIRPELDALSGALRSGSGINCGDAIEHLVTDAAATPDESLRATVERLRGDLAAFRESAGLDRIVVVNLASTEPDTPSGALPLDADDVEKLIDANDVACIRPSLLYAYAAFQEGCAYINFTPSTAALGGGMAAVGEACGVPFMGNDGKTGETLVKSALAPMFKYRNLKVLSWQGYNMLGDRDGAVLAHEDNLASKVRSKDSVLQGILGYPLHTHVGIDFVESLDDLKTAWDFIHFRGFLDHKMSMQFVWQGCDAILAAPLVLDMVRLTEVSMRRGERGAMTQLAPYFKSPIGVQEHDLHKQFNDMMDYFRRLGVVRR